MDTKQVKSSFYYYYYYIKLYMFIYIYIIILNTSFYQVIMATFNSYNSYFQELNGIWKTL